MYQSVNYFINKVGKCDIDSVCYSKNDVNPNNQTQICDPSKSALIWTNFFNNAKKNSKSFFLMLCVFIFQKIIFY